MLEVDLHFTLFIIAGTLPGNAISVETSLVERISLAN
jgi:hypothetical protein